MNILVTGANGQLGQAFKAICHRYDHKWTFMSREELDITDRMAVFWYFRHNSVDVCINCAAYTNVEQAEVDVYDAYKINYIGVANLAEYCKRWGVLLVNYSTDYLFGYASNTINRPYKENDKLNPVNTYAVSKLRGEIALNKANPNYINIRTSWLFSEFGKNFVKTIIDKIDKGEPLSVVNDQVGCPTYAVDLAEATMNLIRKHMVVGIWGIIRCHKTYNFNNGEAMSWYDFAMKIATIYGKKCIIEPTTTTIKFAGRPQFSALDITKYKKATRMVPQSVNDALIECINMIRINKQD